MIYSPAYYIYNNMNPWVKGASRFNYGFLVPDFNDSANIGKRREWRLVWEVSRHSCSFRRKLPLKEWFVLLAQDGWKELWIKQKLMSNVLNLIAQWQQHHHMLRLRVLPCVWLWTQMGGHKIAPLWGLWQTCTGKVLFSICNLGQLIMIRCIWDVNITVCKLK